MYHKILVSIDLTREENAKKLCNVANELAAAEGAEVRLVTVLPDYGMALVGSYFPADAEEKQQKETQTALQQMAKNISGSVSTKVPRGKRAREILNEVKSWQADLIIIGTHKKPSLGGGRILGSCSSSVTSRATCSVLVVR